MNLLDIDIEEFMEAIIDVYTESLGSQYREIIESRIKNVGLAFYNDDFGITIYREFVKNCKMKEFAIKFLKQLGIDISEYKIESYAEELDKNIESLIDSYVGGIYELYNEDFSKGIGAFKPKRFDLANDSQDILANFEEYFVRKNQIDFLNFYRASNDKITDENYDDFKKTSEYAKICDEINRYLEIKTQIMAEYKDSLQELEAFDTYVSSEKQRKEKIFNDKRKKLFEEIYNKIPEKLVKKLETDYTTPEERCNHILSKDCISSSDYFEYFSKEKSQELEDESVDSRYKNEICYMRMNFFKKLGIDVGDIEDVTLKQYESFMQNDDMKSLVPTEEFIESVIARKKELLDEGKKEYIYTNSDFIDIYSHFIDTPKNKESIYRRIANKYTCMTVVLSENDYFPLIFFGVRVGEGGGLDYVILHELLHVIEINSTSSNGYKTGFDFSYGDKNPHNSNQTIYERLNETIVDILAIETRNLLHKKGIYIMEPKERVLKDVNNRNTSSILKDIVSPLLKDYRSEVIEARLTGNCEKLFNKIGEENFNKLNDVVNKVDYLIALGLKEKLDNQKNENSLVKQYYDELSKLEQIYEDMKIHSLKYDKVTSER